MFRLGKRQLHELYYYLRLTRRLEGELARLCREGRVTGPICLVAGLEAVSVGAAYRLGSGDLLASSLPSLGSMLPRGVRPADIFAHFMGKDSGPSRGRDVSILLGDFEKGLVAPTGHPATHLGVMAGVALAARIMGKPVVGVALMSAKSLATGDFHEALNFAAVHQLPLVVVVENDPSSPAASALLNGDYLYERTRGYGVPSLPVDGADILQVLQVIETAVDRARDGKGPTLVEARTTHVAGHAHCEESVPLPFAVEERQAPEGTEDRAEAAGSGDSRDPVHHFEVFLVDHGLLEPVERGLILERIEQVIEADLRRAEDDDLPRAETIRDGVFKGYEPPADNDSV